MKRLVSILLISVIFVSVFSIGGNEVHAEKFKWGKVTIDDEKAYGKIKVKKSTATYKLKKGILVKKKTKLKKGKEYVVYADGVETQYNGNKYIDIFKIGKNLYADGKNVTYYPLQKETRNKLVGNGTLQGTITWQYNKYIGTKPDVDANVIAFPKWRFERISVSDLMLGAISPSYAKKKGFYSVEADAYGNYKLDIPAGKYYVLIKSNKTTRNPNEPLDDYTKWVLGSNMYNMSDANNFGLSVYNHDVYEIQITKRETYTISKDWGYTYF